MNRLLYIQFLQPLEKGESASLDIYYRGALPPPPPTSSAPRRPRRIRRVNFIDDGDLYTPSAGWYPAMSEGIISFPVSDQPPSPLRLRGQRRACRSGGSRRGPPGSVAGKSAAGFLFSRRKPVKGWPLSSGRFREAAVDEDPSPPPINVLVSENVRSLRGTLAGEAREIVRFYEETFGALPL